MRVLVVLLLPILSDAMILERRRLVLDGGLQTRLAKDDVIEYQDTLQDLVLSNMLQLEDIEYDALVDLHHLRTLYVSRAQHLVSLPKLPPIRTLRSLRILNSGILEPPDLSSLKESGAILHIVDFEGCQIQKLKSYSIRVRTQQLIFDFNQITEIEANAFDGSEFSGLSLRGNKLLVSVSPSWLAGARGPAALDLSRTSLRELPPKGLAGLRELRARATPSLHRIPPPHRLPALREAKLTHHFHCCAFIHPELHKDHAYEMKRAKKLCRARRDAEDMSKSESNANESDGTRLPSDQKTLHQHNHFWGGLVDYDDETLEVEEDLSDSSEPGSDIYDYEGTNDEEFVNGDQQIEGSEVTWGEPQATELEAGVFHMTTAHTPTHHRAFCGNVTSSARSVICTPTPNALNPCEDVMGSGWLRVAVWCVSLTAILGNAAVLLVLLQPSSSGRLSLPAPRLIMCHLAAADLLTGLYLLMLASADAASYGQYFNYAHGWQYGGGCAVAGAMAVAGGQTGGAALMALTLERRAAVALAGQRSRLTARKATALLSLAWTTAIVTAILPLFGISDYSSNSICLPLESIDIVAGLYQGILLLANAIAFIVIILCYIHIYRSLDYDTRNGIVCGVKRNETRIALKMGVLVAVDFVCWSPVAFFGATALAGRPLISVSQAKILLVLFYPLNACANPFLYAILTQQYRKDFVLLLARYGLCTARAQRYKMAYSLPFTSNNNYSAPLHALHERRTHHEPVHPAAATQEETFML